MILIIIMGIILKIIIAEKTGINIIVKIIQKIMKIFLFKGGSEAR
jgi:hypothetical protein